MRGVHERKLLQYSHAYELTFIQLERYPVFALPCRRRAEIILQVSGTVLKWSCLGDEGGMLKTGITKRGIIVSPYNY